MSLQNTINFKTFFGKLTAEEKAYVTSQLDPFHDDPYRLTGAPSRQNSNSLVFQIKKDEVYSAASFGLPTTPGSKWDLHVATLPISNAVDVYPMRLQNPAEYISRTSTSEDTTRTLYPVSVHGVAADDPTFAYSSDAGTPILGIDTQVTKYSSANLGKLSSRPLRVIGQSFEVVDESPAIYKQGSVTVYERSNYPNDVRITNRAVDVGAPSRKILSYQQNISACPPNRLKQATVLSSSKNWNASEGAYVISRRTGDNEFKKPGIPRTLWSAPNDPENVNLYNSFIAKKLFNNIASPADTLFTDATGLDLPYNVSGAYFTGLSGEYGTYRVKTRITYEFLPDPVDESFVNQATPTMPYNPLLEQVLESMLAQQPPGYPQTWNPKGEVWRNLLKGFGTFAQVISPGLGAINPELGVISSSLGAGSMAASRLGQKPAKKSRAVRKPKQR